MPGSQDFLLSFVNHMRYTCAGTAFPIPTPSSAATWRLVEGLVRVQAPGAVPVKGLTAPVEAFELVGVTALRRRLQAAAARGLTRFVGRQHREPHRVARGEAHAGDVAPVHEVRRDVRPAAYRLGVAATKVRNLVR